MRDFRVETLPERAREDKNAGIAPGCPGHAPDSPEPQHLEELMEQADPPLPPENATATEKMRHRLRTAAGKAKYAWRKQTVEPVFGIITSVMGFRRFRLCKT